MTTYNTGNPIGSTDARDLYDNAQNLDNFANGTSASYTDRLGVSRRSLAGIDAAANSVLNSIGYAVPVAYASGISLTLTSQTVDYNGVIYAPLSSALPFTTSSWVDDSSNFRAVQVTDADLIEYKPSEYYADYNTVGNKLREIVSARDFGAVGDGVTNDSLSINKAADTVPVAVEYVTSNYQNFRGADVTPDGIAHNRITGRVFNPRQQITSPTFGQECLQHWFSKFYQASNKNGGDTTVRSIAISGDSTTYGVGATYGTPTALLEDIAEQRGYTNVGVINRGQSGKACFDWVSTYLAGDLTCNGGVIPDLLILRWGANDPFFGRTVDQFISDLRTGLATVRAGASVDQMSIVLMTPTSMNDVEMGRSEVWSERIGPAIRQAARDFQCAFIDTYALFQNSHDAAGRWMDADPSHSGANPARAIHPHDVLYEHIVGAIAEMIFPNHGTNWKVNAVRNTSATDVTTKKVNGDAPGSYFAGIGMHRMADLTGTPNGGPYDGVVYTLKQADGATLQISIPLIGGAYGYGISMRTSFNNIWSNWYGEQKPGSSLLVNGWANKGLGFKEFNYQLTHEGRVTLNGVISAGTTTDGTTIFTLPTGYRPQQTEIALIASELGVCRLLIGPDGLVKIYNFGSGGTYISFAGVSFKAIAP